MYISDLDLDKQCIDHISFRKFLGFLDTYQVVPQFDHSEEI